MIIKLSQAHLTQHVSQGENEPLVEAQRIETDRQTDRLTQLTF